MPDATALMRQKLKSCDLRPLFIEELGWNHHHAAPVIVESDGVNYVLNATAEKHGMVAYECAPGPKGQIPDYLTRGKIEKQVTKSAHEHIIVFVNEDKTAQTWQWVRRERGRPTARREHSYNCAQTGDLLIQKLRNLVISLDEEEELTIVEVTDKARKAFDIDQITKHFFDVFKKEHDVFLTFIEGISAVADREWYASLMLNRLMFIYFIQKKNFLDGDDHYLRNRLQRVRHTQGKGKFHSFYRQFLRRLFHEGLAQRKDNRSTELNALLGNVPYLNGGLFDMHQLENDNPEINIPDEAFERLFDFFDTWEWHLDNRTVRAGNEINPDVLGYIFEKYINQKQMGAYYTKEDITEYISKSTIVPFLFEATEKKCAIAFRPEGAVWRLLIDDPDRYIFDTVKKGVNLPLPTEIATGITDVSKRGGWNRPADEAFALPTETWREYIARRTRYLEVRAKLAAGEIHSINDVITYNLDLRQFAQDVIETCEGPDLLRAFYESIEKVSILDPACGSGAFLFAALNILEPLYEACLERMEIFVNELDKSEGKHHPEKFSDFRKVLGHANDRTKHPSLRYFILKSIVLRNLYGVDIMAEAVEICKLRLFLKLMAQVEQVEDVEPLPDIDFNIRAGNTLVGFTSLEAVRQAMTITSKGQHRMLSVEDQSILKRIDEDAEVADMAFQEFLEQQTKRGMEAERNVTAKDDLQTRLTALRAELDHYLATEYGIDLRKPTDFTRWRSSHQPFHWFVEFYRIMHGGGFDVAIGNPPYIEYAKVKNQYEVMELETLPSNNLYAFMTERSISLINIKGRISLIVPLSIFCTPNMIPAQQFFKKVLESCWVSYYSNRPDQLFEGAQNFLSIFVATKSKLPKINQLFTTKLLRWASEERESLFSLIHYVNVDSNPNMPNYSFPKFSTIIENDIAKKVFSFSTRLSTLATPEASRNSSSKFVYCYGGVYWTKARDFDSPVRREGKLSISTADRPVSIVDDRLKPLVGATLLNSGLHFWFWCNFSDCRNKTYNVMLDIPLPIDTICDDSKLKSLGQTLMQDYRNNAEHKIRNHKGGTTEFDEFYPKRSKSIIDGIDRVLAQHYDFTEEELDFIINYDIKYRLGTDSDTEDE